MSPALSPDGKRVVFEALNQLWLMDIGGKPQALTNDKFYKEDPAWSPDGKRIAYSSDKAGTEDIYVLDVATKRDAARDDARGLRRSLAALVAATARCSPIRTSTAQPTFWTSRAGQTRRVAAALFAPRNPVGRRMGRPSRSAR